MGEPVLYLIAAVGAYLFGTIPFGLLVARVVAGIDIRQHGSGNIGATNVARVVGGKWGGVVLALDALKGALPVILLPNLLFISAPDHIIHARVLCGIMAIVGHMYPCWLKFLGGKGVATALGIVVVLAGTATIISAAVFALTFLLFRIVSLSSILAAVAFAIAQFVLLRPDPFSAEKWSLAVFSLVIPLLIIVRHRTNIVRLIRGEEKQLQLGRKGRVKQGGPDVEERDPS